MWFYYAMVAGFLSTISNLAGRYVLRGDKDAWAFSFYYSFFGAVVSLPFFLLQFHVATSFSLWVLVLLVSGLIVLQNFLVFKSNNTLEASISGAIVKFRLVWAFILGIFILHELFTWDKLIGTILTILAGLIIIHKFRAPKSLTGIGLAFTSTILYAVIILFYKFLFAGFNSVSLTFFIFLIPAGINFIFMPKALPRLKKMIQQDFRGVLLACILGAFSNLALNYALSIGEVSRVLVINEAFLVLTLVGEHIFLRERANMWTKIGAVVLATAGAILIRFS